MDLSAPGCSTFTGPCIDQTVFGPVANYYWSATTHPGFPGNAWGVTFNDGFVSLTGKGFIFYVRGVRSGL